MKKMSLENEIIVMIANNSKDFIYQILVKTKRLLDIY